MYREPSFSAPGIYPPWDTIEGLRSTIGRRVRVFWAGDRKWFRGKIAQKNRLRHTVYIEYDDGDKSWTLLDERDWKLLASEPAPLALDAMVDVALACCCACCACARLCWRHS